MQNITRIFSVLKVVWSRTSAPTLMLIGICIALAGLGIQSGQAFHVKCNFVGGGNFISAQDGITKVALSFNVHCITDIKPNDLEVTWVDLSGQEHNFKAKNFTSSGCYDDPAGNQGPPNAPCNTGDFGGTGDLDGVKASFLLSLRDRGEPGINDIVAIVINSHGTIALASTNAPGPFNGNIQTLKCQQCRDAKP